LLVQRRYGGAQDKGEGADIASAPARSVEYDVEWNRPLQGEKAAEKFKTMKRSMAPTTIAAWNGTRSRGRTTMIAQHDLSVWCLFLREDIDVDTGVAKTRRFYALDDCGTRIPDDH